MTSWNSKVSIAVFGCCWLAWQTDSVGQTQGFGPSPNTYAPQYGDPAVPTTGLRQRSETEVPVLPTPVLPQPQAQQFTTGLPFVTPAPGRYPTSPYMGPRNAPTYQNASYQRATPSNTFGQPMVATSPTSQTQFPASNSTAVPNFSTNPAPGIYPTGYQQCQVVPPPSLPPDGAPGQTWIPPGVAPVVPPNMNSGMYSADNAGYRPLFTLGQEKNNAVLGRGIIGQPTAYVPGQCFRNFLRYLSP
jgi:hypothetical protein